MQDWCALGSGEAGGDVDQASAQRGPAGGAVTGTGQGRGGAQQVVGDRGADGPGTVGAESSGRDVGQGSVDEVGEGGLEWPQTRSWLEPLRTRCIA